VSGWQYDAPKEERAAESLLREKGWTVDEPSCPLCQGWGYVNRFQTFGGTGSMTTSVLSQERCPNECETPAAFFYNAGTSAATMTGARTVIADGTVGMRRGE
jgi:hypothetical protein